MSRRFFCWIDSVDIGCLPAVMLEVGYAGDGG